MSVVEVKKVGSLQSVPQPFQAMRELPASFGNAPRDSASLLFDFATYDIASASGS